MRRTFKFNADERLTESRKAAVKREFVPQMGRTGAGHNLPEFNEIEQLLSDENGEIQLGYVYTDTLYFGRKKFRLSLQVFGHLMHSSHNRNSKWGLCTEEEGYGKL